MKNFFKISVFALIAISSIFFGCQKETNSSNDLPTTNDVVLAREINQNSTSSNACSGTIIVEPSNKEYEISIYQMDDCTYRRFLTTVKDSATGKVKVVSTINQSNIEKEAILSQTLHSCHLNGFPPFEFPIPFSINGGYHYWFAVKVFENNCGADGVLAELEPFIATGTDEMGNSFPIAGLVSGSFLSGALLSGPHRLYCTNTNYDCGGSNEIPIEE